MIKYIDTNKIEIPEGFFDDLNVPKFFQWLKDLPTADVVPKSEVAREIFESLEEISGRKDGLIVYPDEYVELKKKYTEE